MDNLFGDRTEYEGPPLNEDEVPAHPADLFHRWYTEAVQAGITEAHAMALATAGVDFKPSCRIVLLRGFEEGSLLFYTNYQSRKGQELLWNPYACAVFYWKEIFRQVRIEGRCQKLDARQSDAYFDSRPETSRLSAIISPQSQVIESRQWLEQQWANADRRALRRPEYWGGYRLIPTVYEFWQGRGQRLHDRLQYTLIDKNQWQLCRLAP